MAHPHTNPFLGMAIFSTQAGQHRQRQRTPGMSVVIRSDPDDDRDTMAARLQAKFPSICRDITTFEHRLDNFINDYFDDYDQQLQGSNFLRAVLLHIAQSNVDRAREVKDLVSCWMATNTEAFALLGPEHRVEHVFTKEDIEEHEMGLLEETLTQIQDEKRLQEQHRLMLHEHREPIFSQSPNFTTFPPQPPDFPTLRVTSNPENSHLGKWQGPIYQIPPLVGQYPTQQARYPQQQPNQSTEVLEHIHTGSMNLGDFHSEPTMNSFNPPSMDYNMAIPSRGLPGSFSYAPQPRVSLPKGQRNYNSCALPRGKKNPAKKSSDDARKAGYGGSSRRLSSNCGSSAHISVPQMVESPQSIEPLLEGQFSNMQIGPAFPGGVQVNHPNRYVTNPFLDQPKGIMVQDGAPPMADRGQGPQYTEPYRPVQAQASSTQNLKPRVSGRYISNLGPGSQDIVNLTASDDHWPPHPSEADNGQPQPQQAPRHTEDRASQRMAREHLKGTRIWIGNIPKDFDRAMILRMLSPCRRLQGITDPKAPLQGSRIHTYVYANFCVQDEAEEALARLPQTIFKCLGEGNFLQTSWPFKPDSTRHLNQNTYNARVERATPQTSPRTTRKGKVSDGSVTGEAGAEAPHSQKESENPGIVLETKDSREPATNSTAVESVDPPQIELSQSPNMAVPKVDTLTTTGASASMGASLDSAALSTEDRGSAAAHNETTGQADQIEKPAPSQFTPYDRGPSTVDGTNDSTPTFKSAVHMEQGFYGLNPIQPDGVPKGPTAAKLKNKKTSQISKTSNKPQNKKRTQHSRAVSLSENTKPAAVTETKTISVAEGFSGEAAHPGSGDDAAGAAQNMSRDGSNLTDVADGGGSLYHSSTAPTSYLQTERSNSPAAGSRTGMTHPDKPSLNTQTRNAGVDPEQLRSKLQTDIKATIGAGHDVEPSVNAADGENLKASAPDMSDFSQKSLPEITSLQQQSSAENIAIDKDTKEFAAPSLDKVLQDPTVATSPHTSPSAIDRAEPREREREQEPAVPARSSSLPRSTLLPLEPTPVLTGQTKKKPKKPKNFAPAEEKGGSSGSKLTASVTRKQPIDTGLTSSEQTKSPSSIMDAKPQQSQTSESKGEEFKGVPSLTIASGLRTPSPTKLGNLPEHETSFKLDGRADLPVVKGLHQRDSQESNPSAGYNIAAQSNSSRQYGGFELLQKEQNATESSQELREAMEEAGYLTSLSPSSARHFAVKDPILARLGDIFEQEEQGKEGEAKDDKIQFGEKGVIFVMSQAEMQKQIETRASLETAAAGKRLAEGLPPRTPPEDTKGNGKAVGGDSPAKSLYDRIEKIVLHNVLIKATRGERNLGNSLEDRTAKEGRALLDTSPKHGSSKKSLTEWITKAEQYVKGSKPPDLPLPATPTRRSKTSNVHHSSSSLMMSLHKQGKLPEGSRPVVTTKPGSKTAVIKLKPMEDASQIAADHLANPDAIFGTDKIKLSSLEKIHAAFAKPGGAISPSSPQSLSRRTPSEERQMQFPAQSEPLEKKAAVYWNQNSGFRDSDMQDELWEEGDDENVRRGQKENGVSASQFANWSKRLPNEEYIGDLREPKLKVRTSRDQCEEAPGHNRVKLKMLAAVAAEARADGQQVDDPASSPRTVTGDYPDNEAKKVISILGSESGDTTESRQDDAEYPVLPRGRSSHVKGCEGRAPSKGGYAAAARKSIDEKREHEEKEGKKQGSTDSKRDPWAPEDVWGPGKSDGKGTSVSWVGMSKRGFH